MTRLPIADDDAAALARLLARMVGHGFRLAVVELRTPVEREALAGWASDLVRANGGELVTVDLRSLPGVNLWEELHAALDPLPPRAVLLLHGLETSERRTADPRAGILRQLNVQRDVLVRDFAVPWLLILHPSLFASATAVAPDFFDYAVRRVPALPEAPALPARVATAAPSTALPPLPLADPGGEAAAIVAAGWDHVQRWELDKARDALSRLALRRPLPPEVEAARLLTAFALTFATGEEPPGGRVSVTDLPRDGALGGVGAVLRGADAFRRGDGLMVRRAFEEAERALAGLANWAFVAERLLLGYRWSDGADLERGVRDLAARAPGEHECLVVLDRLADLLEGWGRSEEALRIRREELLPAYERLGDVRSRAVTLGKIADVLQARGELEHAIRIQQEEELPVYERLGDVRERAVTLGRIADVLQARGELDEALRIRREEELPVFERLGDVRERAVALGKIADVLEARGELDEAMRIWREEELPVFVRLGDVRGRAVTLGKMAGVSARRGRLSEAIALLHEECLPAFDRLGLVPEACATRANLAVLLRTRRAQGQSPDRRRDKEDARALLRRALADAERLSLPSAARIRSLLHTNA